MAAGHLAAVVAGLVFAVLGWRTALELQTRGYRIPQDTPTGLPRSSWWAAPVAGVAAAYLTWRVGGIAGWAALPAYLVLAWLAVPLVWIDRDVHRIPVGLVRPAGITVAVLLILASWADGTGRWRLALAGAVVSYLGHLALWALPGGMGYGDVRLAPVLAALLGWLGLGELAVGIAAGFLVGGVQALVLLVTGRARAKSAMAFGPAMLTGAIIGVGETSRIATWLLGG